MSYFTLSDITNAAQNILINGGMEIWQRNTSFTSPATNAYTADRWKVLHDDTPTFTVSRDSVTVDSGTYSMKVNVTAIGTGTFLEMTQDVEDFVSYAGKTVSLSMRVWSNNSSIQLRINDGVGVSDSSAHPGDSAFHTLTVTRTISSSATRLRIQVGNLGSGFTTVTFYADSAMLILGSEPSNFTPRLPEIELALCQRYYEKSYEQGTFPGASASQAITRAAGCHVVGSEVDIEICFKTTKRTDPSVTLYTPGGTSGQARWWAFNSATFEEVSTSANPISDRNMIIFHTTSPDTYYAFGDVHWTADAEI